MSLTFTSNFDLRFTNLDLGWKNLYTILFLFFDFIFPSLNKIKIILDLRTVFQFGPSPLKKNGFTCFIEIPLKMMKNAALFVLKTFRLLPLLFGHAEKTA